jgi:hypothetical protein
MRGKAKIAGVITCAVWITQIPDPGIAQSAAELAKSMQVQWMRCLKDAYQVYERRTPTRNSAAEMAFQFCSTEEDEVWTFSSETGVSRSAFEQLKSATKKALSEGK